MQQGMARFLGAVESSLIFSGELWRRIGIENRTRSMV